ncbi:MAG: 5'-deoxynucleotidase [Ruminococcaceae bacterium]|nr:5'-deoxynucleotidase [Oscillospiraceae bacterium]
MSNSFFAFAFRMKYINRWGLMKNSRYENLTEHSAQTAMIAHCLAVIGNKIYGKSYDPDRIALFALYHDVSELVTGDLPTPVKYYNDDILKSYREIEERAKEQILKKLPDELYDEYFDIINENCSDDEHKIIKAADKLCALIKCIEEVKNGNSEFTKAHESSFHSVENTDLDEVKYFIDNMLPAFYLTLDEL